MRGTLRQLFPRLPQHDSRSKSDALWEIDQMKSVIQEDHDALIGLQITIREHHETIEGLKIVAHPKSLTGHLSAPVTVSFVAIAVLIDPAAALKIIGKILGIAL